MIKNKFILEKVSIEKNMAPRSTFFQKRDSKQEVFLYRYFFCLKTEKKQKKGIPNAQKISIDQAGPGKRQQAGGAAEITTLNFEGNRV